MAYGRGKLVFQGVVTPTVAVQGQQAFPEARVAGAREGGERGEIEALRAVNARLLGELDALKEREAQAQRLADRDPMTGLYNRRRMTELLDSAIAQAAQQDECVGVLFIDLNGFKGINDGYGHAAGDKVLTTVATRIAARVRNGDIVCRYGGDEFVVILPNVPDAGAVTRVADAIRERISLPCWTQGNEQHLTAAIGEALCPHDGRTSGELLRRADLAMYHSKARLARPIFTMGSVTHHQPSRRRNDKYRNDKYRNDK